MMILVLVIVLFTSGWKLLSDSKVEPINADWQMEAHDLWFNWGLPCWYSRYYSAAPMQQEYNWLLQHAQKKQFWNKGIDLDSETLFKILARKMPHLSGNKINEMVTYWSIPIQGEEYALVNTSPYKVMIRSRDYLWKSHRDMHLKISAGRLSGCYVEVWNNWIYDF